MLIGDRAVGGTGVGTATIELVARAADESLKIRKIAAGSYASNVGSKRAFEEAGFAIEGLRPRGPLLNGQAEDLILMGKRLSRGLS